MGNFPCSRHEQRSGRLSPSERRFRYHRRRCPLFGRRHVPQRPRRHHRVVCGECGALRRTTARHSHRCVECPSTRRIVHLQHLYLQHRRKRGDDRFPPKKVRSHTSHSRYRPSLEHNACTRWRSARLSLHAPPYPGRRSLYGNPSETGRTR